MAEEENATLPPKEQQIHELEEYINQLDSLVRQKKQAENLLHNKDFQDLILETYCKKEVVRYLKLAVLEDLPKEAREDSLSMAEDAAKVSLFLDNIIRFGAIAERDIVEARKLLVQIESEPEQKED